MSPSQAQWQKNFIRIGKIKDMTVTPYPTYTLILKWNLALIHLKGNTYHTQVNNKTKGTIKETRSTALVNVFITNFKHALLNMM